MVRPLTLMIRSPDSSSSSKPRLSADTSAISTPRRRMLVTAGVTANSYMLGIMSDKGWFVEEAMSGKVWLEVFLPLPLGEGWGEGLCASSFAPSPNPSQREGKNHARSTTCSDVHKVYRTSN